MSVQKSITIDFENVVLEKIKESAGVTIGAAMMNDMDINTMRDYIYDQLYVTLTTNVLARKLVEDSYEVSDEQNVPVPRNAWQMFKRDHAPAWFLKRFPVDERFIPVHFHKVIKITRRALYPQSDHVIEKNKGFAELMGPAIIKDTVEGL